MPEEPTPTTVCHAILEAYGDRWFRTGSVENLTHRIDRLIDKCETTTIIIDEAQRLVDRDGTVAAQKLIDWFKSRHSKHNIALIFLGLPRLRDLFEADRQIERRWDAEIEMPAYRWKTSKGVDDIEGQDNFMGILVAFLSLSRLTFAFDIHDRKVGQRFHYASGGIPGHVKKLILRLIRLLNRRAENGPIDLPHFAAAFDKAFRPQIHGMVNPFLNDFDFRETPSVWLDDVAPARGLAGKGKKKTIKQERMEANTVLSKSR
jgi:hypothetical protein